MLKWVLNSQVRKNVINDDKGKGVSNWGLVGVT